MSIPSGTRVSLDNGHTKPVEDLQPGDVLITLNEESWDLEPKAVLSVTEAGSRPCREIRTHGRKYPCTPDHRVMTGFGWLETHELVVNDLVAVPRDGLITYEKVSSLGVVSEKHCWDVKIESGNAFLANGVITIEAA